MTAAIRRTVTFPGVSIERLKSMLGAYNGHLKQIEQRLDVTISHRGDAFYVDGEMDAVEKPKVCSIACMKKQKIRHKSVPIPYTS